MNQFFKTSATSVLLSICPVTGWANQPKAPRPVVTVRVFDYAETSQRDLGRTLNAATAILDRAGVEVRWALGRNIHIAFGCRLKCVLTLWTTNNRLGYERYKRPSHGKGNLMLFDKCYLVRSYKVSLVPLLSNRF